MLGPAVLAPPFSGRTQSGRGCRSTTTPTRARVHLPLSLSHHTRDRKIRYEPPGLSEPKIVEISELRATRTEDRIKAIILMREHLPNVGQTGWCTFVQSDIVI